MWTGPARACAGSFSSLAPPQGRVLCDCLPSARRGCPSRPATSGEHPLSCRHPLSCHHPLCRPGTLHRQVCCTRGNTAMNPALVYSLNGGGTKLLLSPVIYDTLLHRRRRPLPSYHLYLVCTNLRKFSVNLPAFLGANE